MSREQHLGDLRALLGKTTIVNYSLAVSLRRTLKGKSFTIHCDLPSISVGSVLMTHTIGMIL